MLKPNKVYVTLILIVLLLVGCATSSRHLRKISLDMTKQQILNLLGEPAVARGAIRNKYSQIIEVWEYTLALPSTDSSGQIAGKTALTVLTLGMGAVAFSGERKEYWLYFYDNKLVQWGEAGDWRKEPERIYEFNFAPSPTLTK